VGGGGGGARARACTRSGAQGWCVDPGEETGGNVFILQRLEIWTGKSQAPERIGILLRLWSLLLRCQGLGLARACNMFSRVLNCLRARGWWAGGRVGMGVHETRARVRAWTGRDRDVPPDSAQRAYTLVCGCVRESRCVSESVCIWGLGGVSGGAQQ
jgi:hypothetical protein